MRMAGQIVQLDAASCASLEVKMDKTLAEGNLCCSTRQLDVYQVQRENKRKRGTNKGLGGCFQEDCLVINKGSGIRNKNKIVM